MRIMYLHNNDSLTYPIVINAIYIGPFSTALFKRQEDFSTRFRCGFKHGRWNITLVLMGKP